MHYYKFNIGDYASHTAHLDPIEDIAYRRMLDWHYLHESPLPDSVDQVARIIRMRTHCEAIETVLREFFTLTDYGWEQSKVVAEIDSYKLKSDKAKASAAARWSKKPIVSDANALRDECESNANHKPLTTNQEPLTKKQVKRFVKPTPQELIEYFNSKGSNQDQAERFFNHYESNGWKVGRNPMKAWKSAVSNWLKNNYSQPNTGQQVALPGQSLDEELRRAF